jgi:8-oxo-dGTP diphosphatase
MIEFGNRVEGAAYVERPGAYGIIQNASNAIAVVRTRKGYLLPGGGVEPGETLQSGLRREILEELGCESKILAEVCAAAQFIYDKEEDVHWHKVGHFFSATLGERVADPAEKDHELVWLAPDECVRTLAQEFQAWAIGQAFKIPAR